MGAIFWFYNRQPLYHTDLWGHLAYGRFIWETGALPETEPFMPLAQGVPIVDTAWLVQVAGFLAIDRWGPAAIQFLHALAISVCFALLTATLYRRTNSFVFTLVGLGGFEALNWFQFQVVRPQMAGLVCCAVLLAVLSAPRWHAIIWVAIPVSFAVWANVHGSFAVGLGFLGLAVAGRAIDVWRRTKRLAAPAHDRRVRRLFLVTGLAAAAVLINPYGIGMYAEAFSFSRNPNLSKLLEWQPLALRSVQGEIATGVALGLVVVLALSPRRIPAGEMLALVVLAAAALMTSRMLIWWTPVAAGLLALHAHAVWCRFRRYGTEGTNKTYGTATHGSRIWMIVTAAFACVCFATTPFGQRLLLGREQQFVRCVSAQTPVAATAWLAAHPPQGQVFNSYEWGDYLVWAGPPNVKVFVTSQAHVVPRDVWIAYFDVIFCKPGWEALLDQYAVETVFVDKAKRGELIAKLRKDRRWSVGYEDGIAVIFSRGSI